MQVLRVTNSRANSIEAGKNVITQIIRAFFLHNLGECCLMWVYSGSVVV
jgi:hypothetical protein